MDEKIIGKNIRNFRELAGLTLTSVADAANITKSTLSKIEKAQISSPISTYIRIADALNLPISDFFVNNDDNLEYEITRKGKGKSVLYDGVQFGYNYEALAGNMRNKMAEPFILTISPDESSSIFSHEGEEFCYVISGQLENHLGDKTFILKAGDSIYFNARHKHFAKAMGGKPAKILCIFIQRKHSSKQETK